MMMEISIMNHPKDTNEWLRNSYPSFQGSCRRMLTYIWIYAGVGTPAMRHCHVCPAQIEEVLTACRAHCTMSPWSEELKARLVSPPHGCDCAPQRSPADRCFVPCAGVAQNLFGSPGPHEPEYMHQYWGSLASRLTYLDVQIGTNFTEATSAALCQLSNLHSLRLRGVDKEEEVRGHFSLQLPVLEELSIFHYNDATVELECSQLKSLTLGYLSPLRAFSGMPRNLESLRLTALLNGFLPLESICGLQKLEKLKKLAIKGCSADAGVVGPYCFSSNLTRLTTDCDVGKLLSSKAPWSGLFGNLQQLDVHMSLQHGIPVVLEQLTSLRRLIFHTVSCSSLVHLDRPLHPLLDLPSFESLHFYGDTGKRGSYSNWSAPALVLLGQAEKRILDMQRVWRKVCNAALLMQTDSAILASLAL